MTRMAFVASAGPVTSGFVLVRLRRPEPTLKMEDVQVFKPLIVLYSPLG
jgi:hypothetical protein